MRLSGYIYQLILMLVLFAIVSAACLILIAIGYEISPGLLAIVGLPPIVFAVAIVADAIKELSASKLTHDSLRRD